MDDELKAQVVEFYRRAIAEGATEEQAVRLARRFVAEQRADGGPTIGPSGPTATPMFSNLSPRAGGALDALIVFGNALTFGGASAASETIRNARQDIKARNPRTATGLEVAGGAMALPVAGIAGGAAAKAPSVAAAVLRNPITKGLGFGGGALGGVELVRRLLGMGR